MSKNKTFQIVATNYMLRHFRQIDIFTVDLGFAMKQKTNKLGEAPKIKVRDTFVKQYENINVGKFIHKYGQIGSIVFYEDSTLSRYEFHIYKDDKVFELEADSEDLQKSPGGYLTEVLQLIEKPNEVEIDEKSGMIKNLVYTNLPEDIAAPNNKLEKTQYIDALVKRKELIEKLKNQNKKTD